MLLGKIVMTTKLSVEDIGIVLDNMVQYLHREFGEQLVSVMVYGSYAREAATRGSDVDLLIVVRSLPRDWQSIHRLENELMLKGRQFGKRFQITLVTPDDVSDSVEYAAPMMLEIHNAHKIILDRGDFFKDCMERMEHIIEERGIRIGQSPWGRFSYPGSPFSTGFVGSRRKSSPIRRIFGAICPCVCCMLKSSQESL
jgi:predicted nucleotidyltransferase